MTSRAEKKKACSGPPRKKNKPYDNRPRSGPDQAKRRSPTTAGDEIRVILPDEPPRLTPGAARVLLRILLEAHDRLADVVATEGDTE